jgi:hypothetical protein
VRSEDGGRSFGAPVYLPLLRPGAAVGPSECGDPVLAWSPNGQRLFAAYRDLKNTDVTLAGGAFRIGDDVDVLVSHSDDRGLTWSAPAVALDADPWAYSVKCEAGNPPPPCAVYDVDPGASYERPALATPLDGGGTQLYVTATRFAEQNPEQPPSSIVFRSSGSAGDAWDVPLLLDEGSDGAIPVLVQGAKAAGGRGGELLVAWYSSGADGHLAGEFEIRVRRSLTNGRTWGPVVTAVREVGETSSQLGPLGMYKQWWPTMFPDVAIDRSGRAHLVYGYDPEPGNLTPEEGDVRYTTSSRRPWMDWSTPFTLNDDGPGRAQGFAALTVLHMGRQSVADVAWEDTRLSPELPTSLATRSSSNLYYDVFHARWRRAVGGGRWSANQRVSDRSSLQERYASGSRVAISANALVLFAVWPDRRDVFSPTDLTQDVFGSSIRP